MDADDYYFDMHVTTTVSCNIQVIDALKLGFKNNNNVFTKFSVLRVTTVFIDKKC